LNEKKQLMQKKLALIKKKADLMQEGICTMNLYLGAEEQVTTLKQGDPCPATEVIKIRQQILYMDEECAIAADKGGIDLKVLMDYKE